MPQRRFPRPWRFEPIPGGYRVIVRELGRRDRHGGSVEMSDEQKDDDKQDGWRLPFLERMPVSPVISLSVLAIAIVLLLVVYLLH
jgi:hypothetical protein